MGGVVVAERSRGYAFAPSQFGATEEPAKEAGVKRIEDFFEVVEVALRPGESLAAARVANELGLTSDCGARGEALEAQVVRGVDGLSVQLGQQDVGDRTNDTLGAPSIRSERLT